MTAMDWVAHPFFEEAPERSVDGGTTSAGDLWHAVSPRWGHSMHTMCSYYGMFPAKVAHYFIQRYSKPGDLVVDPFSGRGTTVLQACAEGRIGVANDLSPLAFVLSAAKADPPSWSEIHEFTDDLERKFRASRRFELTVSPDIQMLYHDNTLRQLVFIREQLHRTPVTQWSKCQLMFAGCLAGIMHGGWRQDGSSQYLSISMPNTFSMSPSYVSKFIDENGLEKLDQDVFERLREKYARMYLDAPASGGRVVLEDATRFMIGQRLGGGTVDLLLTSPPYLQVVNYGQSNWIRLWLMGVDDVSRDQGSGRRSLDAVLDHRHTYNSYREFMSRTVSGIEHALAPDGVAVLVIGDVANPGKEPVPLAAKLWADIQESSSLRLLEIVEDDLPAHTKVTRIWGETKGQATNRDCALVLARKGGRPDLSRAVDWTEPYKDAGPDAAHDALDALKYVSR
jgi:hypothetical protein